MLKTLVEQIIRQNPNTTKNYLYLCLSVWEREGLKLYPNQVEALLNKCSKPFSIVRAAQKLNKILETEKQELYKGRK